MSFSGKVVLITGAGSGIGADAACHLAKLGASVSIVDLNEERLIAVSAEIKRLGLSAPLPITADVTKDAERIVDETIKAFGKLDVLINNVGYAISDSVIDVNLSEFDRLTNTNVRSMIELTKLCIPHLEQTKGNIVNTSSYYGIRSVPNFMSYCMSKAAVDQFTKCSALDLAPKGIRVNSINPSFVRTRIFEQWGIPTEQFDELLQEKVRNFPINRLCEVTDTSAAIAYLADNNVASFLTGVLLPVDGGGIIAGA